MNRTIKDATVKRYFYDSHDQLSRHLRDFVDAYNFARRLKTLKGLTPYEFICKTWTIEPQRFKLIFYTLKYQAIDCKRQSALKRRLGTTFC